MQTSSNPAEWKEHPLDERARFALNAHTPHHEKRGLYPLSARLIKASKVYPGVGVGRVLRYVRTKLTPAIFPVEVLYWDARGSRMFMAFAPDEVELLPPQDASDE